MPRNRLHYTDTLTLGPGCSSSLGLFMELGTGIRILYILATAYIKNLGPCRVTNATEGPTFFKKSWNSNANVFFVDQPVDVGFSYAEHGQSVVCDVFIHFHFLYFLSLFTEYLRGSSPRYCCIRCNLL